jgi:NADH:ubiquinone oxidoreductase subunit 4 (subunit M)
LPYVMLIAVLLTVGFCPRLLTDIIQNSVTTMLGVR